jgi:hypothetical protein
MRWTEDDLDRTLKALAAEDPPDAALERLHGVVLERTRPRWQWRWAWVMVPALGSLLWLAWTPTEIPPPPLVAAAPRVVEIPAARLSPPAKRRPSRPMPPRIEPANDGEYVKIATADPNVVILWKLENEGETR